VLAAIFHHLENDPRILSVSLKQALNGREVTRASLDAKFAAASLVHEASRTADKGFIDFYHARKLASEVTGVHRLADTVAHVPGRLLRYAKRPRQLAGTDAVLRVDDEPHGRNPFGQWNGRVFKDGANLRRELLLAGLAVAHHALARKLSNFIRIAMRTTNAIRPADANPKFMAGIRLAKATDNFQCCFGNVVVCHGAMKITLLSKHVKLSK